MTTCIREFDTNGKYVDNRIHVVKSDKMKYIWAEGKRECAPSGVRIHIRWEGTMNQLTIDLNQVDCRGIGVPIFRLAGTDLCYTRPFGVERTWNKTRCALRCGGAGGVCDVARRYCLDNNGHNYWSSEPTLGNYPRQDKRAQYNRGTTNNQQQVNLQPALAQPALPQPILPQPVLPQPVLPQPALAQPANFPPLQVRVDSQHRSTQVRGPQPPELSRKRRGSAASSEDQPARQRPRLSYERDPLLVNQLRHQTGPPVYDFDNSPTGGSHIIVEGSSFWSRMLAEKPYRISLCQRVDRDEAARIVRSARDRATVHNYFGDDDVAFVYSHEVSVKHDLTTKCAVVIESGLLRDGFNVQDKLGRWWFFNRDAIFIRRSELWTPPVGTEWRDILDTSDILATSHAHLATEEPASNNDTASEAEVSAVRLGKRKIREVEEDVVEEDKARVQKRARHFETARAIEVPADFDIQNVDLSTATPETIAMAYAYVHSLNALDDEEVTEALLAGPDDPALPSRDSSSLGGESSTGASGPPSAGVLSSAGTSPNSSAPAPVELSLEEILRDNPLTLEEDGFTAFVPVADDVVSQWEMEKFIESLRS